MKGANYKGKKKTISLNLYILLHFLSNLLQIFTVYSVLNFKEFQCRIFFFEKKSPCLKKEDFFFEILFLKMLFFNLKKFQHTKVSKLFKKPLLNT